MRPGLQRWKCCRKNGRGATELDVSKPRCSESKESSKEDDAADDDVMPPPSPIASIDFNPLFRQLYLGDSIVEDVGTENDRTPKDAGDHHWSRYSWRKKLSS